MVTLLDVGENFEKAWRELKKKDEIAIKKVERRFARDDRFANKFKRKVYDVYEAYKLQIPHIATVLEEYLDTTIYNAWFGTSFSKAQVCSVLMDTQFVAMLMCTSLLKRTVNLERRSEGQLKLRVYIAILNFDRYRKQKVLEMLRESKEKMTK